MSKISSVWHLLQTTDSLFPTGAYAHSGGLEGLACDGLGECEEETILGILERSFARVDLPACGLAHRAAESGDLGRLIEIDAALESLKVPRETREASGVLGRRRMRSLAVENPLFSEYSCEVKEERTPGHQAVVTGLHLMVSGIPREEALLSFIYSTAAGLVGAAMKLFPLGQNRAQALLMQCGECAGGWVADADGMSLEDLGCFTPVLDIASMRHETAYTRLFIS